MGYIIKKNEQNKIERRIYMKLIAKIEGMHCNGCRTTLELALNDSKNIEKVSVNLEDAEATIEAKDNIKFKEIEKIVKKAGFKCVSITETEN